MTEHGTASDVATDARADLFEEAIEASRQMRRFLEELAGSLGLTAPQAHALPGPMGSAAEKMRCARGDAAEVAVSTNE